MNSLTDAQLQFLFYGAIFALVPVVIAFVAVLRQILRGGK